MENGKQKFSQRANACALGIGTRAVHPSNGSSFLLSVIERLAGFNFLASHLPFAIMIYDGHHYFDILRIISILFRLESLSFVVVSRKKIK